MREIKFRYIVKDEFGELHTIIKTLGQIAHSATERNFSANNCEIVARDEWTGLLDANGREVYEGDILAREGFRNTKVYFHGQRWYPAIDSERHVVIGNIYENAELVE